MQVAKSLYFCILPSNYMEWYPPPPSSLLLTAEQNCLELCELGVAPRLVGLLSASDKATRSHAILCLSAMATSGEGVVMRGVLWEGTYYLPPLSSSCCAEGAVSKQLCFSSAWPIEA